MALKAILDSIDGLPADVAKEYKENDDGKFVLDVEGLEDTGALKRAKDHEKSRRQKAESKAAELESKLADLQEQLDGLDDPGKNKADDKQRIKLEQKIKELESTLTSREQALFGEITRLTSDTQAAALAASLSDSPNLLLPHIKSRLVTEMVEGKAVVKVRDADGDIGSMTIEDLKKEFSSNKEYSAIIRGSEGSGSGAPGGGKGGGGERKPLDYSKATPKEIAEDIKAKKEAS
jgi:hypothetical protein